MKGREAFKKIREINLQLGGIMPIVDSSIEAILIEAGWASPETLASEYVRLDKEIKGRINCDDCPGFDCTGCEAKILTVADMIGDKG